MWWIASCFAVFLTPKKGGWFRWVSWLRSSRRNSCWALTMSSGGGNRRHWDRSLPGVALQTATLRDGTPIRAVCAQVEANFLRTLGVRPLLGRDFTIEDDRPNSTRVVLVSYGLWQQRFGGDRSVEGRTLFLDGTPATVAGVLPRDFELPTLARADLIIPQALDEAAQQRPRTGRVLRAFGRLKAGSSLEQAEAAMRPLFQDSSEVGTGSVSERG